MLVTTQNNKYNAIAKEAMGTISDAFTRLRYEKGVSASSSNSDLIPYLNYVKIYTDNSLIDATPFNPTGASFDCDAINRCLALHNGARLMMFSDAWNGTSSLHAMYILLDPDGQFDGNYDGLHLVLYYNTGRISTFGTILPNTVIPDGTFDPMASNDPTWFKW